MGSLFHYTTIEALKCILKYKTIRLRPLSTLDDMEEALSQDSKAIGNYIFVSSWSAEGNEMIPMWFMYSDQGKGVRLELPTNPFVNYSYSPEEQLKHGLIPIQETLVTMLPLEVILAKNHFVAPWHKDKVLKPIEYTDETNALYPQLWTYKGVTETFSYGKMGICKNTYWSFQKEWRYILHVMPFSLEKANYLINNNPSELSAIMHQVSDGKAPCPIKYFDLEIDPVALSQMKIVLGPLMSQKDADTVRGIANDTDRRIMVLDSQLKGRLREKNNEQ